MNQRKREYLRINKKNINDKHFMRIYFFYFIHFIKILLIFFILYS